MIYTQEVFYKLNLLTLKGAKSPLIDFNHKRFITGQDDETEAETEGSKKDGGKRNKNLERKGRVNKNK